jgi:hypothetical protein
MTDITLPVAQHDDILIPSKIAHRIHYKEAEQPSLFISENDRYDVQIQAFVRTITDKKPDAFIKFLPLDEIRAPTFDTIFMFLS